MVRARKNFFPTKSMAQIMMSASWWTVPCWWVEDAGKHSSKEYCVTRCGVALFEQWYTLYKMFSKLSTSWRILFAIAVIVVSGEWSFSRLHLIKTYLRSTLSHERLRWLSVLSIRSDVALSLDFSSLLCEFASRKAKDLILANYRSWLYDWLTDNNIHIMYRPSLDLRVEYSLSLSTI